MVFREQEIIRYCLDDLIKYCDKVLVLLDNYDKETEKIILEYRHKFPQMRVIYSKIESSEKDEEHGTLKCRLNHKQGEIRDQVLREIFKMNKEEKIDLLVWPDGDEIFTDYLWHEELPKFWQNNNLDVLFTGSITPFNSFKAVRNKGIVAHAKIFKYRSDMTALPYRNRCFYHPFIRDKAKKIGKTLIHLALFNDEIRALRRQCYHGNMTRLDGTNLWQMPNDIRKLTPAEVVKAFKAKPFCSTQEYYADPNKYKKFFA